MKGQHRRMVVQTSDERLAVSESRPVASKLVGRVVEAMGPVERTMGSFSRLVSSNETKGLAHCFANSWTLSATRTFSSFLDLQLLLASKIRKQKRNMSEGKFNVGHARPCLICVNTRRTARTFAYIRSIEPPQISVPPPFARRRSLAANDASHEQKLNVLFAKESGDFFRSSLRCLAFFSNNRSICTQTAITKQKP